MDDVTSAQQLDRTAKWYCLRLSTSYASLPSVMLIYKLPLPFCQLQRYAIYEYITKIF